MGESWDCLQWLNGQFLICSIIRYAEESTLPFWGPSVSKLLVNRLVLPTLGDTEHVLTAHIICYSERAAIGNFPVSGSGCVPTILYESKLVGWVWHSLMASTIELLVQIVFPVVTLTPGVRFVLFFVIWAPVTINLLILFFQQFAEKGKSCICWDMCCLSLLGKALKRHFWKREWRGKGGVFILC